MSFFLSYTLYFTLSDLTLLKSSDSYPMVEVRRVELLSCIKTEKPSTYLVLLLISC